MKETGGGRGGGGGKRRGGEGGERGEGVKKRWRWGGGGRGGGRGEVGKRECRVTVRGDMREMHQRERESAREIHPACQNEGDGSMHLDLDTTG